MVVALAPGMVHAAGVRQGVERARSAWSSRYGQRVPLLLDIAARLVVIAMIVLALRRVDTGRCEQRLLCDDAGLRDVLVGPLVAYLIWNVGYVVLELLAFATVGYRDSVSFVAAGAAPRLLWLVPLAVTEFDAWPWLAPLVVLTLVVVGLAIYPVLSRVPAIVQGIDSDTILG